MVSDEIIYYLLIIIIVRFSVAFPWYFNNASREFDYL